MQAWRAAHQREIVAHVEPRDLVFIDESGCNRAMTRTYARSPCGTRARGSAPRNWGDHVSIVSALGVGGPLATMPRRGAINGEAFLLYLDHFLLPKLWPGAVVVMDNLSAHKPKAVRTKIEAVGARLVYLPPYSPDFQSHRTGLEQTQKLPAQSRRQDDRSPPRRYRRGSANPHRPQCPKLVRSLRIQRLTQLKYARARRRIARRANAGAAARSHAWRRPV